MLNKKYFCHKQPPSIGDIVKFSDALFESAYALYYEAYQGHTFKVDHFMVDDEDETHILCDHVWLICVDDPSVIVKGFVHIYDLESVI